MIITIPRYILIAVPPLIAWWTRKCSVKKEYLLLAVSIIIICAALAVLAFYEEFIFTRYAGSSAATGIWTLQIPLSVFATAVLAAIPVTWIRLCVVLSVIVGEVLLLDIWIS